jgi:alkylation response protein AidB-like acyl-CoA dehydrogenase
VERGMKGFERGRNLEKMGLKAQDTAELFFDDVRVPAANLVGELNGGFIHLMNALPQERLSIAVVAVAASRKIFDITLEYCKERTAFGRKVGSFQHNRFVLAEMATEIEIAETYLEKAVREHNAGRFTVQDAAMAKWWTTELQKRVMDQCVQLHGGYGYMLEYPVAKAFLDSRVQTIYGGTTEIMKEIIGRSLGV